MRYVALLRGVNVGGHKKLPMLALREVLSSLGFDAVATYIQSGNALFTSPRQDPETMAREIEERIERDLAVVTRVLIRTPDELATVIAGNPFPNTTSPSAVYVAFLSTPVDAAQLAAIDARRFEPDEFRAGDRVIYLRFPNGAGATKLTNDIWERQLGAVATTRNWNTVTKLLALASADSL